MPTPNHGSTSGASRRGSRTGRWVWGNCVSLLLEIKAGTDLSSTFERYIFEMRGKVSVVTQLLVVHVTEMPVEARGRGDLVELLSTSLVARSRLVGVLHMQIRGRYHCRGLGNLWRKSSHANALLLSSIPISWWVNL